MCVCIYPCVSFFFFLSKIRIWAHVIYLTLTVHSEHTHLNGCLITLLSAINFMWIFQQLCRFSNQQQENCCLWVLWRCYSFPLAFRRTEVKLRPPSLLWSAAPWEYVTENTTSVGTVRCASVSSQWDCGWSIHLACRGLKGSGVLSDKKSVGTCSLCGSHGSGWATKFTAHTFWVAEREMWTYMLSWGRQAGVMERSHQVVIQFSFFFFFEICYLLVARPSFGCLSLSFPL